MERYCQESQSTSTFHLLGQIGRLLWQRRREKMERLGLYHAQAMVLFRLFRQDGISQSELAAALHVSLPTMSNTLQRMERDGWVIRYRDEADKRIVRIQLTDQAKQLRSAAYASLQDLDEELTAVLSEQELDNFRQALFKVHHYLLAKEGGGTKSESSPSEADHLPEGRK